MTKQELLEMLERTHNDLLDALNGFSDSQMTGLTVIGAWTPKDVLAHVVEWENVCGGYLEKVIAGEPIPLLDLATDGYNARAYARDRDLTLGQVWSQSDKSFARVRAMVESLQPESLQQTMRGPWLGASDMLPLERIIAIDTWEHYQNHIKDIESWRQAQGQA